MRDLRRLTLEQLRAFVSVAESSSFTDAARAQLRSQTAVTRQIKSIEDIIGERLLRRSRGHVEGLTEAGKRLLPFARRTLATIDDAWAALSRPNVSGSITIGIMDDIEAGWLNELVSRFKHGQTNCEIRAISDFSSRLEHRVQHHEIDIAIVKKLCNKPGAPRKGLLRREPLVWAAGPGFRWNPAEPIPVVAFHEGCIYRAHFLEQLRSMGLTPFIAYEGQSYANVRAATYSGFGITALAESQIIAGGLMRLHTLGHRSLANLGMVEIVITYSEKRTSPALRAFMSEIERFMLESPGCIQRS